MADKTFAKEDFVKDGERYKVEFKQNEVGAAVDLIVERQNANDEYEVIQAEITRSDESIFVFWSEPFNGRIVSDEYKKL